MSASWYTIGVYDPTQPADALPNAEAAAKKALGLDDAVSAAHAALADVRAAKWDWPGAEKEFQRAVELNPNDGNARRAYAMSCLAITGRLDQALQQMKRAQDLDPISVITAGQFGALLYFARQYDQSIEQSRTAIEMEANAFGAHNTLGRAYLRKGMLAEALAEFDRAERINRQPSYWSASLAGFYANAGNRAAAERLLDKWKQLSGREIGYHAAMAMIYTGLRDKDQAFHWLEKAYRERWTHLPAIKVEPEFDALRSDPRFHALLKKMGVE